jgi:hypothetical protein
MQIRSDFTKEELIKSIDPLVETCHPLTKLKTAAALLYAYPDGPFTIEKDVLIGVSEIIEDATKDVEFIIELSNELWQADSIKLKKRTQALKDCIVYLEDPDDKPDIKTMMTRLKKQIKY